MINISGEVAKRNLMLLAALLASTPAFAITANGGTVNTGARVQVNNTTVSDPQSSTAAGLPTTLSSSSTASFSFQDSSASAASSIRANWASATQGSAALDWGWAATNPGGVTINSVNTLNAPNKNWEYNFTTGASAGTFTGKWSLAVSGGNTFGIQGVYSYDGNSPFNITPFNLAPTSGSGSFSVALAPNTTYEFSFTNYGNLGGYNGDASASFAFDWTIDGGGGVVPEPASWAMLITGFGLVGAGMRRRRHQTA